jgi:hypothetical protein
MRASMLLLLPLYVAFHGVPSFSQVDGTGAVRAHIEGIEIANIPNAPFTAKVIVTWDQPLVGGGAVSKKYYTLVARDAQGRVHREMRGFIPASSDAEPPLRSTTISDPVSGTRTICTEATMSCATSPFHPRQPLTITTGPSAPAGGNGTVQDLGQQTMDGLTAVGTRVTSTDVSGSHGSSRVALTHTETWYSPDLQMDLSVNRTSPQLGQVTLTVTELKRGVPEQWWFAIPSNYELRTPHGN